MAIRGELRMVVSQDVLDETIRNLERKSPHKVPALMQLLDMLDLEVIGDPTPLEVKSAEAYVVRKDAPILAAARKARVAFFVTLDRKHFKSGALKDLPLIVGTPGECLAWLRMRIAGL